MYILSQDKKKLINLDNYTLSVFWNSIVCKFTTDYEMKEV